MSKFFVAFLFISVVGLSALNSVNAECKPGPDCTDCWCHTQQGYGCCEGFDCDSSTFAAGTCQRTICKGAPDCENCWCHAEQGYGCCEGFDCDSGPFLAGTCHRTICKGAPDCENCWCDSSLPCCAGHYCAAPPFGSGFCVKGQRPPSRNPALHG